MPIFIYKAIKGKRRVKGDLDAANLEMAEAALRRRGMTNIRVKPKPKDLLEGTFLEGRVKDRDMVIFSRQFATMIDSGVPILQALQVMCEQTENDKLRRKLYEVRNDIEGGSSLYEALRKHPDVFDDLYTNMVNAGETGGVLDVILDRLATYIEKAANLKSKVRAALIYPGVVSFVAVAVIAIILIFVIPTFEQLFNDFGSGLPTPTKLVIGLSRWVKGNLLWLILGLVAALIAFRFFYRWERGRTMVDRFFLTVPVFGPLMRKFAVARFSRTFSTMVSSGVPILQALDIVARTSGNKIVESGVNEARTSIAEGQTLADPLDATGVFPPMVIHMISIGETTGSLDTMLGKIADFYDDEVDVAVTTLTSLIEPILIVFLGVIVGGLVVSMYLPIFKIAGTVAG
ncbi:type II secretion system F family protein [Desulfohalobium retbaense]|uniref:Type II secretion system F domain protein n=1 Tax=Desulfohalobium retbaense (strain ATCC 49708 / DSM 5692 / JCM 16813 / HR100) TaxID=485915 RepID=C8X269_DESRD|nr:type II secretion system F family protein [Desulfohalobium retbaense]ACV68392.1 Type II secretion system F domain protein [Desulfohalobium retbaense DSM 5692]